MKGPNLPYEGNIVLAQPLETVAGKFYAAEILGRDTKRTEWQNDLEKILLAKEKFERILRGNHELPIVISMPHFTRVYRVGNPDIPTERETNFHGQLFNTQSGELLEGTEVGCDAEIAILATERYFWHEAQTVEEYLQRFAPIGTSGRVVNPNKFWEFRHRR